MFRLFSWLFCYLLLAVRIFPIGDAELLEVFNGYLLKYEITPAKEKWVIFTFVEDGKVHLIQPYSQK